MRNATRPAAVAGMFYPARPEMLADLVDECLRDAAPEVVVRQPPKMLLVPHAGYVYSGPIAARAFALLAPWRGRIRRVVLLGPTHRVAVQGLAVPQAAAFATPLGRVPVDHAAIDGLAALTQVVVSEAAHAAEHSLEVQLPFLQRVLGDFELVPLAVGHARPDEVAAVIERLWGGDETLIVISSDLSHYLSYDDARDRDRRTIQRVLRLDPDLDHEQACGATPLAGALIAARRHGLRPRLLDLRNSGDTAGDRRRVVGYAAVVFEAPPAGPHTQDEAEAALGRALLAQAHDAIAARLGQPGREAPADPALDKPGASFVTLRRHGALRGCIGTLQARRPLGEDVRANALAAAFEDPRFAPLSVWEFPELEIEVSVLDPAEPMDVHDWAQACRALRPGVDGVILECRGRRATFLPQVWDELPAPEDFLRALCHKAGLPDDAWSDELRLWRYRVRKFKAEHRPEVQ